MIGPCDAEWRCLASRSALDILSRGPLRTRTRRSRSRAPEEVAARGGFPLSSSPRLRSHSLPCAMRSAFRSIAGKKKGPSLNAPSLARLRRAVSQCGLAEEHRAAHLQIGARHRRAFDPGTAGLSPPLNLFFCRRFLSLRGRPAATRHANGHSNKPPTHLSLSFLSHFFAFSPSPPPQTKKTRSSFPSPGLRLLRTSHGQAPRLRLRRLRRPRGRVAGRGAGAHDRPARGRGQEGGAQRGERRPAGRGGGGDGGERDRRCCCWPRCGCGCCGADAGLDVAAAAAASAARSCRCRRRRLSASAAAPEAAAAAAPLSSAVACPLAAGPRRVAPLQSRPRRREQRR